MLYQELSSTGSPKEKEKLQLQRLLNSTIVMMVASWEAFVEDLAKAAFQELISRAKQPKDFPKNVLTIISKTVKEDKNDHKVFSLCDSGWRDVFKEYQTLILQKYLGRFNTPSVENVNALFEDLIGLKDIKSTWRWEDYDPNDILSALDNMIKDRGDIAHRAACSQEVNLHQKFYFYSVTVFHISAITSNRVAEHIEQLTGTRPWNPVKFEQLYNLELIRLTKSRMPSASSTASASRRRRKRFIAPSPPRKSFPAP